MRIEYYSWMLPHIPRVADIPDLQEWPLPTFAKGKLPERLAAQMAHRDSPLPSADTGWDDKTDDALRFVRACPDKVYRAGTMWLIRARFELNPGFLAWTRYNLDDFNRVWYEDQNPAWRNMTREDFAETFAESWPTDWASQDEFMANLKQGPLSFLGISGPLSLSGIVRSLQRPRYATIYTGDREAAGFLWAEGYTLPDGLDSAQCEPEGSGPSAWTGWAQIGALVRLKMLTRSGVDILQREGDAEIDFLPVLPPDGTAPPATALPIVTPPAGSAGQTRTGPPVGPTEETRPPTVESCRDDQPVLTDARDTFALIKRQLELNPKATSVAISKATGIPNQTVRRSKAWTERPREQAGQVPNTTDAMDHVMDLSTPMLAVIDSHTPAPADIVAEREEPEDDPDAIDPAVARRRRFLEAATTHQKRRLFALPSVEQERELEAWDLTGDFMPDDGSSPLGRRMTGRRSE